MPDCRYPRVFCYWIFLYAAIFVVLFANFYRQTYNKNKAAAAAFAIGAIDGIAR